MAYADGPMELPETGVDAETQSDELYRVGIVYSVGMGVDADLVKAHQWFNLAALKGSDEAKSERKEMADQMSSDEIAQAQKAAREWLDLMN
ncbi:MAG: SEL1-like repeat protein [Hyphomonadaceae bacterium]